MSTSASASGTHGRYVIKEILGQGGMGVVYRAYDTDTRRDVTLKTLLDPGNPSLLELFRKEQDVLSQINHPNIVDVYDVGQLEDGGVRKPYFVMPMLLGTTLDKLIMEGSHRLSVERAVDIVAQICRGLHAAHERGLVHRDVKPSNVFVLDDDSVKIIDFGVAHLTEGNAQTSVKGTLHYMAPEQLQMQRPTPASDQFSVAVVCYETLTRRKPFQGANTDEIVHNILHTIPPPVSEINPAVSRAVSQVIHKAMAKQAFHRFASAKELAEALRKALRGEALDIFDEQRMASRVERAKKNLESGELEFADEVVSGLEAEGYIHPDMGPLRRQINEARREQSLRHLLDNARRCLREEEYLLALQKVDEILKIDPHHGEALGLQSDIESRRSSEQINKWVHLAQEHLQNHAYGHARRALEDVLQLNPDDPVARKMMSDLVVRERDYLRMRKEKEELYEAAMAAWRRGEITSAMGELERVIELDKRAPDNSDTERAASYQRFYNQVRGDHDALRSGYDEARRHLNQRNFKQALATCETFLKKYPDHALFKSLKVDIEEQQRQDLSAFIARVDREVEAEPDLERRVSMIRQAMASCPGEPHFEKSMRLTMAKRDLVNSIVSKARASEERKQFGEALNQWEMLRTIYAGYPGLEFEVERLAKRRDQQARSEAKSRWSEQIDASLGMAEWARAQELAQSALADFPDDPELEAMAALAEQGLTRVSKAQVLLEQGKALLEKEEYSEGAKVLRDALALDERDNRIRAALVDGLLKGARSQADSDPGQAEELVQQALELEPRSTVAKSLQTLLADKRRDVYVESCTARVRQMQVAGEIEPALNHLLDGLALYPGEPRLVQLKASFDRLYPDQKQALRSKDLSQVKQIADLASGVQSEAELKTMLQESLAIAQKHEGDHEFQAVVSGLRAKLTAVVSPMPPALPTINTSAMKEPVEQTVTSFEPVASSALDSGIIDSPPQAEAATLVFDTPPAVPKRMEAGEPEVPRLAEAVEAAPPPMPPPMPQPPPMPMEAVPPPPPLERRAKPVESAPVATPAVASAKKKSSMVGVVIGVVVALGLAVGGGAIWFMKQRADQEAAKAAAIPAPVVPEPVKEAPPPAPTPEPEVKPVETKPEDTKAPPTKDTRPLPPSAKDKAAKDKNAKAATTPAPAPVVTPPPPQAKVVEPPPPPKPVEVKPPPPAPKPAGGWSNEWVKSGDAMVLPKGSTALYSGHPSGGVYEMTVACKGGFLSGCNVMFLVNVKSAGDQIRVMIDRKNIVVRQLANGTLAVDPTKKSLGIKFRENKFPVRFSVTPTKIVVAVNDGSNWITVETINGTNLTAGRFGIAADSEVTMTNFSAR